MYNTCFLFGTLLLRNLRHIEMVHQGDFRSSSAPVLLPEAKLLHNCCHIVRVRGASARPECSDSRHVSGSRHESLEPYQITERNGCCKRNPKSSSFHNPTRISERHDALGCRKEDGDRVGGRESEVSTMTIKITSRGQKP